MFMIESANFEEAGEKIDIYLEDGEIRNIDYDQLWKRSGANQLRKKAVLILQTSRGDIAAAYDLICKLYQQYEKVAVFIPTYCFGAGTLIAHACDELILGKGAKVGPLDGFGNRLILLSSKSGSRAFQHLSDINAEVGLIIDDEVAELFDNVMEPTQPLKVVAQHLFELSILSFDPD